MFIECEKITGTAISDYIVSAIREVGLELADCRSQFFDEDGNMAGIRNGCAANFREVAPRAPYFHCASHDFNLVLCKSCKIPAIHCMLENLKALGVFYKCSPKRTRRLEKAKDSVNQERATPGLEHLTKLKIKPVCDMPRSIDDFRELLSQSLHAW